MADWDDTPGMESLTIHGSTGQPLARVRHEDGRVLLDSTRPPGRPTAIAPADARDLAAGLVYIARCAELAGAEPQAPGPGPGPGPAEAEPRPPGPGPGPGPGPAELTIADEVKASAWMDAAALIRHVLEQQTDLRGFHWLEDCPDRAWLPQALAVIACDLLGELTEATARLSQFGKKSTPEEILAERLHLIKWTQMRRGGRGAGARKRPRARS